MDATIVGRRCVRSIVWSIALCVTLGFAGCKKPVATEQPPEETSPTAAPAPATPEPKAVAVATPTPAQATPAPELAPPGVFYLVTAARVETNDGVVGLPPGTGVKLVRPGIYLTPAGEVPLNPAQLTNDMGVARRAANIEKNTQAAIQQRIAAQTSSGAAGHTGAQGIQGSQGSQGSAPMTQAQAEQTEKDAARAELQRQRDGVIQQSEAVGRSLSEAAARWGNWELAARKSPQAFQLLQQYNALQKQRADLEAQIAQIR